MRIKVVLFGVMFLSLFACSKSSHNVRSHALTCPVGERLDIPKTRLFFFGSLGSQIKVPCQSLNLDVLITEQASSAILKFRAMARTSNKEVNLQVSTQGYIVKGQTGLLFIAVSFGDVRLLSNLYPPDRSLKGRGQ
jgi:hypothetical protein